MTMRSGSLLFVLAAALTACQARTASVDKAETLEKRVQELEKQLGVSATPSPSRAQAPAAEAKPTGGAASGERRSARKPTASAKAPASAEAPSASSESSEARAEGPAAESRDSRVHPVVAPRAEAWSLPEGTELTLLLETPVSSSRSRQGDAVVARVERAEGPEGRIVLPGGTVLKGRVAEAVPSGRVKGRARVSVAFDRIVVRGRTHEIEGTRVTVEAPDDHGRDAKIIGGGSAAGAVLGAIADGKKGFVRGAVIGATVGGGAVLATKGREIELPAGSRWKVRVTESVRL